MTVLRIIQPHTKAEKSTRTVVDTIVVSPELVRSWSSPPFQRPLKINERVRALAEEIKRSEVLPGTLTLGVLGKETYLIDGQHRCQSFLLSGLKEGFTDIRMHHFDRIEDMGAEFVRLQSSLVRLKPDDVLRGLEACTPALQAIRAACPVVGYDQVRRGPAAPMVSMSAVLRCWRAAGAEVPATAGSSSAHTISQEMSLDDANSLSSYLVIAEKAWGRDPEYQRLWGSLTVTLTMWLFRKMVLARYSAKIPQLDVKVFAKCMMSLSANAPYVDWLLGRQLCERDRSPAYGRIKGIFAARITEETGGKAMMPAPPWYSSGGRHAP